MTPTRLLGVALAWLLCGGPACGGSSSDPARSGAGDGSSDPIPAIPGASDADGPDPSGDGPSAAASGDDEPGNLAPLDSNEPGGANPDPASPAASTDGLVVPSNGVPSAADPGDPVSPASNAEPAGPASPGACIGPDIDVPSVLVSGAITVGGVVTANYGVVSLVNGADRIEIGTTTSGQYSVRVIPGSYEFRYSRSGAEIVLREVTIDRSIEALDIDLPSGPLPSNTPASPDTPKFTLSGQFKVNGIAAPATPKETVLSVRDEGTTGWWWAGRVWQNGYEAELPAGTYDLAYTAVRSYEDLINPEPDAAEVWLPDNSAAVLATGVVISEQGPAQLDFDLSTGVVRGTISLHAEALLNRNVSLVHATLGEVQFMPDMGGAYSHQVVSGSYDLRYSSYGKVSISPFGDTLITSGVEVTAGSELQLDVDIPSVHLSGTITSAGALLSGRHQSSPVYLRSQAGQDLLLVTNEDGSYDVEVVPGTYQLVYDGRELPADSTDPVGFAVLDPALVLSAPGSLPLDIDVPSVELSGQITVAGAALLDPDDEGTLYLRNADGSELPLGSTADGAYAIRTVAGTYDLYYDVGSTLLASLAPLNARGKIMSDIVMVSGERISLDIDVPVRDLSGVLTIAGLRVDDSSDGGRLWLTTEDGDSLPLGWTSAGQYSTKVLPGSYDLIYEGTSPGDLAPHNTRGRLGCFVVE